MLLLPTCDELDLYKTTIWEPCQQNTVVSGTSDQMCASSTSKVLSSLAGNSCVSSATRCATHGELHSQVGLYLSPPISGNCNNKRTEENKTKSNS